MPISREQFEKGLDSLHEGILAVLRSDPHQAFTLGEVIGQLNLRNKSIHYDKNSLGTVLAFSLRMDYLKRRGLVEIKDIGFESYYAIKTHS